MSKCGKGCMPECKYFTTGGCISPFNCPYKIETGYINSATSTTDSLTGLLMEFDEMSLLRQYRALDPEKYAIEGREKVRKEIERLKSENAAMRERLEKAVELKVKVGDTIYMPWTWDGNSGIAGLIVREIQIVDDGVKHYITSFTTDDLAFAAHYKFGKFREDYFGKMIFATPEAAEARLTEMKDKESD